MGLGNYVRVALLGTACLAAVGSATSNQNANNAPPPPSQQFGAVNASTNTAPPPQQMDPSRAIGLWRSTFGAVKIEADNSKGGLQTGSVQGVWVYQRQGQEVVGYFSGNLRGNVMQFRWQEPANPPLIGEGYLVFDQTGRQYAGRWWTDHRDRVGDWNGWRGDAQPQPQPQRDPYGGQQNGQYGGAQYGYQDPYRQPQQPPPAYRPNQQQPYAPSPYAQPRQPRPYQPAPQQPPPPPPQQDPYY